MVLIKLVKPMKMSIKLGCFDFFSRIIAINKRYVRDKFIHENRIIPRSISITSDDKSCCLKSKAKIAPVTIEGKGSNETRILKLFICYLFCHLHIFISKVNIIKQ